MSFVRHLILSTYIYVLVSIYNDITSGLHKYVYLKQEGVDLFITEPQTSRSNTLYKKKRIKWSCDT